MKAGNIKGALLEYFVRQLFRKCGFTVVKPDDIYIFQKGNLLFINGKGAAHDADVLMEPPLQIPFSYPSRVLFECKSYESKVKLPVVRNALGLRNDIQEFEIVTKDSLNRRKNNRRAEYAIENRKRYFYQVGVAAINKFTKPAIEFSANNKIPLLSLSWLLGEIDIKKINQIDSALLKEFSDEKLKLLYQYLKDSEDEIDSPKYYELSRLLREDNIFGDIITFSNDRIKLLFVGILETGDMIFLYAKDNEQYKRIIETQGIYLEGEIHYHSSKPNFWELTVYPHNMRTFSTSLEFFLPDAIFQEWKTYNLDRAKALEIKQKFFPKIFLFNKNQNNKIPFIVITLNEEWLNLERNI